MCGLLAFFGNGKSVVPNAALGLALNRMIPRGPDGRGIWQELPGVYLGHQRLSIVDLDPRAAQPMASGCRRYTIVFNGEIYNYRALREQLLRAGRILRTTSDTEVIIELFAIYGEDMLERLHGMFSFVIWDALEHKAFAARDPYGIKPLYFAAMASGVVLASQVRAILATGLVDKAPDAVGQAGFWLLGSVPEPYTWYAQVHAVPAGGSLWIAGGEVTRQRRWHDITDAWRSNLKKAVSYEEIKQAVHTSVRASVERHLTADVPVGVLLSSGIDSGALAGLMAEAATTKIEAITLSYSEYEGSAQDEAPLAAMVAAQYDMRHTVRRVSRAEFEEDLPKFFNAMDQPSVDGINTWYATKAVAELGLKVVVSGVGGDELFQGYNNFRAIPRLINTRNQLSRLPGSCRLFKLFGQIQAKRTGKRKWAYLEEWSHSIPEAWLLRRALHAPDELPRLMGPDLAREALDHLSVKSLLDASTGALAQDPQLAVGQIESSMYMRNQLLRDSDWASMDHGVELRTPLVDALLLEQLTPFLGGFSRISAKTLLGTAPKSPLPTEIIERKKTGFGVPIDSWRSKAAFDRDVTWAETVVSRYETSANQT